MSWKDNFIFLPRIDQNDCDYHTGDITYMSIDDIIKNDQIFAFNSKNYLKNNIKVLRHNPSFGLNDGTFIKKDKVVTILNNLDNSDDYLHIDNKSEIDRFIDKIKFNGPEGETIMFTNANSWYIDTLVLNLMKSYDSFNKDKNRKIGVFCSDKEAYDKCLKLNFECCMFECDKMNIKNSLSNTISNDYKRLTFVKTLLIDYIISKDITVLYIDPDMSFNYKNYPNYDFINDILKRKHSINYNFENDQSILSVNNYDIKVDNVMAGYIYKDDVKTTIYLNSNLMLISPTFYNKILFKVNIKDFENICTNIKNGTDETYICRSGKIENYISFWNESYFPNGENVVKYKNVAYMFHANCVSGLENKIKLLKDCGGWFLDKNEYNCNNDNKTSNIDNDKYKMTIVKWQNTIKNENDYIVQASQHDITDTFCSIGMGFPFTKIKNKLESKNHQFGKHDKLVLSAISINTDERRRKYNKINRKNIVNTLKNNNIYNQYLSEDIYFEELPKYKFIISPEGNGIDCHRHYEALMAGCIPIVEDNPIIRKKYGNCPILYTKDYSEITEEYLNKKYIEMNEIVYDFSRLLLSNYTNEEQNVIKTRGNYWCNLLGNKFWYSNYYSKNINKEYFECNNYEMKEQDTYSLKDSKNVPIDRKLLTYLLSDKKEGFFIDIGCKDGTHENNTYLLENKYNWKGILIESELFNICQANRPNNILIKDICELKSILNKYNIEEIDFLNIATDESKLNLLKNINSFLQKMPKVILIKISNNELEEVCLYLSEYYNIIGNYSDYNTFDNPDWNGNDNYYLFKLHN